MSRIAAVGEQHRVEGFALAGALVVATEPGGVPAAWDALPDDVDVIVLTPAAADALGDVDVGTRLRVVLPA